jgi:hypothetical protein
VGWGTGKFHVHIKIKSAFQADRAHLSMMNVPKTHCRSTSPANDTGQEGQEFLYAQRKKHYDRKQKSYVWWAD